MNRFNTYINSHFSGCRLLARARDECRNRMVTLHQIPGHWDVVGVTDGTDAWIAPAVTGPFFKTATGDVTDMLRRLQAGEDPGPVPDAPPARERRALLMKPEPAPETPAPRQRRAIVIKPVETLVAPRRPRHAITQA